MSKYDDNNLSSCEDRVIIEIRGKRMVITNFNNFGGIELQVHDSGIVRIVDMCNNLLILRNVVDDNSDIDMQEMIESLNKRDENGD